MRNAEILKQAHQSQFRILGVGGVKSRDSSSQESQSCEMRNAETPFCVDFGYWEMERQNTSSQGMPECRNDKMQKTPFGVGFRYRECQNTLQQEYRNDETLKCVFELGYGHHRWSHRRRAQRDKIHFVVWDMESRDDSS